MAHRFQFRLKSLLLVMVFFGILCGVGKWQYDAYVARLPVQLHWKPYSRNEMSKLRSGQRPVLIDFTVYYEMNGAHVHVLLEDDEVAQALDGAKFELRASGRKSKDEIRETLDEYDLAVVPMFVIHPAGKFDQPIILLGDVKRDELLKAIEKASKGTKK